MNKILYTGLMVVMAMFASCDKDDETNGMGNNENGYDYAAEIKAVDNLEYVELAGIKWATCNLGADRPELYGNHYSWIYDATNINQLLEGKKWRLPTKDEFQTLIDSCEWEHISMPYVMEYYVEGYEVKDPRNGNKMFLPQAGKVDPDDDDVDTGYGYYWTSNIQIMKYVLYLALYDDRYRMESGKNYYTGMSIRLVHDDKW